MVVPEPEEEIKTGIEAERPSAKSTVPWLVQAALAKLKALGGRVHQALDGSSRKGKECDAKGELGRHSFWLECDPPLVDNHKQDCRERGQRHLRPRSYSVKAKSPWGLTQSSLRNPH